jgi:hypothetical protein
LSPTQLEADAGRPQDQLNDAAPDMDADLAPNRA